MLRFKHCLLIRPEIRFYGDAPIAPAIRASLPIRHPAIRTGPRVERRKRSIAELLDDRRRIAAEKSILGRARIVITVQHLKPVDPDALLLYRSGGDIADDLFGCIRQTMDITSDLCRLSVEDTAKRFRVLLHQAQERIGVCGYRVLPHQNSIEDT